MPHTPLKRKEDIGLSPYELKFRGRHRSEEVQMTVWTIGAEEVQERFTRQKSYSRIQIQASSSG